MTQRVTRAGARGAGAALLLAAAAVLAEPAARTLDPVQPPRAGTDFTLPALGGGSASLADFQGRYVLVNFWAVWCTPCRTEMPALERLAHLMEAEGLQVLGVHVGPSAAKAATFVERTGLDFPIVIDEALALDTWQVSGLPMTYLLDPAGNIIAQARGERDWDQPPMLKALERLMVPVAAQ